MNEINAQDLAILETQLGRQPRGVLAVETRCPSGHPQTIKVYPLLRVDGKPEPFPTLFWLSCPRLSERLSRLEHEGLIARLETLLEQDPLFFEAYQNDHRQYLNERWETLTPHDRQLVEQQGWRKMFRARGIGGIENWRYIKCLHLHYAHHLARKNVIGQWLSERYKLYTCQAVDR